ncbi:MAG TPA: hypothetical protein VJX66_12070 [Amycolatopsis sp.]|nr:hypothetical protein [Amycolatopsis sp.]
MTPGERTLYHESGVSWIALLWAPLFALIGALAELVTGGPVHVVGWVIVALGLFAITTPWVYARRRYLSMEVTQRELRQGREKVPAERIAEVTDVGAPVGARVLGGGWTVPRKYDSLPIRLDDGTVVLAWARDVEALRDALVRVVRAAHPES